MATRKVRAYKENMQAFKEDKRVFYGLMPCIH